MMLRKPRKLGRPSALNQEQILAIREAVRLNPNAYIIEIAEWFSLPYHQVRYVVNKYKAELEGARNAS